MSASQEIAECAVRESATILAEAPVALTAEERNVTLNLMRQAYHAGFKLGIEAWGEALDRMQGLYAEASE